MINRELIRIKLVQVLYSYLQKGMHNPDVAEKELLLILAPVAVAEAVFQAVRALPCFAEKGSGIEFSVPVRDFTALGR